MQSKVCKAGQHDFIESGYSTFFGYFIRFCRKCPIIMVTKREQLEEIAIATAIKIERKRRGEPASE